MKGRVWYHVPFVGRFTGRLDGSQRGLAVRVVATVLVVWAAWLIVGSLHDRLQARAGECHVSVSDELELGVHGATWTDDYPGVLFDGLVLVPGAEATATMWVRNVAGDDADIHFAATRIDVDSELSDTVTLQVTISGGDDDQSDDATFAELRTQPNFGVTDELGPGAVRRVEVTLRMASTASNEAQIDDLQFALEVQLSESVAEVPGVPIGSPGGGLGPIPATGVAIGSTVVIAMAVVVVGSWFAVAGRRKASRV